MPARRTLLRAPAIPPDVAEAVLLRACQGGGVVRCEACDARDGSLIARALDGCWWDRQRGGAWVDADGGIGARRRCALAHDDDGPAFELVEVTLEPPAAGAVTPDTVQAWCRACRARVAPGEPPEPEAPASPTVDR